MVVLLRTLRSAAALGGVDSHAALAHDSPLPVQGLSVHSALERGKEDLRRRRQGLETQPVHVPGWSHHRNARPICPARLGRFAYLLRQTRQGRGTGAEAMTSVDTSS